MHMIFTLTYIKLRNLDFQFDEVSNSNLSNRLLLKSCWIIKLNEGLPKFLRVLREGTPDFQRKLMRGFREGLS